MDTEASAARMVPTTLPSFCALKECNQTSRAHVHVVQELTTLLHEEAGDGHELTLASLTPLIRTW